MDFDDFLSEAPVSRVRVGNRFVPKAKAKPVARKEISTSNQASSSNDRKNEHVASSSMSSDTVGNVPTKNSNPSVDLTPGKSANELLKSSHTSPVEIPVLDSSNPDLESSQQINVNGCDAVLVEAQPSTITTASEVNSDCPTDFPKIAIEADPVGFDVGLVADPVPVTNLHNANSTIDENEIPTYWEGEGPFLDGNKSLEPNDYSWKAGLDVGSQSASDCKVVTLETRHSNSKLERVGEVESAGSELDLFSDTLPDPGLKNARKFRPKIKPQPRVRTAVVASSSDGPSQSEPSTAMLSENAVHNGPSDWHSNSGKPMGETIDIFSALESLDDSCRQDGSSTGNPALHSFNEKGTEDVVNQSCDIPQIQEFPDYKTTHDSLSYKEAAVLNEGDSHTSNGRLGAEEVGGSIPAHSLDDILDYSFMNNSSDPTLEIPVCEEPHEEPMNSADNPTYDDLLHMEDAPGENDVSYKENDTTMPSSPKNHMKSSVVGEEDNVDKPRRQLRKRVNHQHVDTAENGDSDEEDELDPTYSNTDEVEEHDEYGMNNGCTKKKRKSVTKNAKPRQKCKRANEDSDKAAKVPRKKFSHSTQRRRRCVDKALLEIPEDELDPKTLRMKDIILLAEYRERQAKKKAAASKTSSINGRNGDSLHQDSAHSEDMLGSEYGRGSDYDQAKESIHSSAPTLYNYQSFMDKKPRGKWSKQDTQLFYEAVRQFGTDFSMIQQLFPDRTRHQIKLKYKQEERQHPLLLSDAVNNRAKDLFHFKAVFERLQEASAKTEQDTTDAAVDMTEEMEDLASDHNPSEEQDAKTEKDEVVRDHQEDNGPFHSAEKSVESDNDDYDDDFRLWSEYKSDL